LSRGEPDADERRGGSDELMDLRVSVTMPQPTAGGAIKVGFWAAILTVVTVVFAVVGVATPPRSGPFCGVDCVPYPYKDVARFIPGSTTCG
jgi:hypothetical protein